jgi:hypothetical protein
MRFALADALVVETRKMAGYFSHSLVVLVGKGRN